MEKVGTATETEEDDKDEVVMMQKMIDTKQKVEEDYDICKLNVMNVDEKTTEYTMKSGKRHHN